MHGNDIYVGPVSKRARRDWDQLGAGQPMVNNPLYVTLDYTYATNKPGSGNFQYSEGLLTTTNAIEGFNRCAIVSFTMNNATATVFPNARFTQLGLAIQEIPGNTLHCNVNQVGSSSGNIFTKPTFLVPVQQPPDSNGNIWYREEQTNEFSVPISGLKLQTFHFKLCDGSFYELSNSGSAPTSFSWTAELRFYNEYMDGTCGC